MYMPGSLFSGRDLLKMPLRRSSHSGISAKFGLTSLLPHRGEVPQQRRDSTNISPVRLVDWYLSLSLGQKIVVGVAVSALVLVGSYLASLLILSVAAVMRADNPPQGQTPPPASPRPGASASASASASSAPAIALKIERARWEG